VVKKNDAWEVTPCAETKRGGGRVQSRDAAKRNGGETILRQSLGEARKGETGGGDVRAGCQNATGPRVAASSSKRAQKGKTSGCPSGQAAKC